MTLLGRHTQVTLCFGAIILQKLHCRCILRIRISLFGAQTQFRQANILGIRRLIGNTVLPQHLRCCCMPQLGSTAEIRFRLLGILIGAVAV